MTCAESIESAEIAMRNAMIILQAAETPAEVKDAEYLLKMVRLRLGIARARAKFQEEQSR